MTVQSDLTTCMTLLQGGRQKAAYDAARKAMGRHKTQPEFPNIAGIALCGNGKYAEGIQYFKKALNLSADFSDARKNLAQTMILLGQFAPAETQLARLVRETPRDGAVWYLLAQARLQTGQLEQALEDIEQAISIDAKQARNHNLRGLLHDRLGQPAEALEAFEKALALNPNDVETLVNISLPLARQLRVDEATEAVRRAVALAPGHLAARLRLGMTMVEAGQTDEAKAAFAAAIEIDPLNGEAYEQLVALNDADANETLGPAVRRAYKKAPKNSETRAALAFAQARVAQQQGDSEQAAEWLRDANRNMAALRPFDSEADDSFNDKILARFPAPLTLSTQGGNENGPRPIYVLGLPRSGTTLAEAVLGAHPRVIALGERATAGIAIYPLIDSDAEFDADAFRRIEAAALPPLSDGTRAFVDKMPENYRLIGFLKTAHPECRIINMRRDPRDIALSMWRGRFTGRALDYTYDQQAMARRFNTYARMMAHWHRVLPGQILDLSYEEMVSDIDSASRTLADWCGLEWDAAMARPNESAGQVLTMSAAQIRQPVHRRSVGGWKAHEPMLREFIDELDPALWPEIEDD
ncbi:MAG: tetratricopeptide repeat-containing sulfotransferase family protein [Heliomarina sp.]|uniref:tetratricopeptide repeat-containing sulfotransferase family protein n=1 Tax=Heliomarina sp. TaxID=2917556 RepID=UPI0040596290